MKTKVLKSLLTLIFAVLALPMLSQDFMNIYFKDGTTRKFYLGGVSEITTSQYDAAGIKHFDYAFQHVKTPQYDYVFNLAEIDSIAFSKFYEEKTKQDFSSAMTATIKSLSDCETIDEAEKMLNQIKAADGVEDAWSDGHELYVKVNNWETISFHFNHDDNEVMEETENAVRNIREKIPQLSKIVREDGHQPKVVIANQQHYDEAVSGYINKYYKPLLEDFKACGFDTCYIDKPTINFYTSEIYQYDVIFIITHGGYGDRLHRFLTGEKLGEVAKIGDKVPAEAWEEWSNALIKMNENTLYENSNTVYHSCNEETRDGVKYWVGHPSLRETFFGLPQEGGISEGTFPIGSILFNTACHTMDGPDIESSVSLAKRLIDNHGLGIYYGYNGSNYRGRIAGYEFFESMLEGKASGTAFVELPETLRVEKDKPECAILTKYAAEGNGLLWLGPLVTNSLSDEEAMSEYNLNNKVNLWATMTSIAPGIIEKGVKYGTQKHSLTENDISNNVKSLQVGVGNYQFSSAITDLKRNTNYFYCAYTFDGVNYHYGDTLKFCIGIPEALQLSANALSLITDGARVIRVNSGSGKYSAKSDKESVATVGVNGMEVTIEAVGIGLATITITDSETEQSATITVIVSNPKIIPSKAIDLGLPSGTKWAEYNLGASKPEEFGGYYAWGELNMNGIYDRDSYYYYDANSKEYSNIGTDISGTEYDVAHVLWGGDWCMPTQEQFKELIDNCSPVWTKRNGVNCMKFTGRNGATLYLPAAGRLASSQSFGVNDTGEYWTSTLWEDYNPDAYYYTFSSDFSKTDSRMRFLGLSIRPVVNNYIDFILSSTDPLSLLVNDVVVLDIISGNGDYTVESDDEGVAKGYIKRQEKELHIAAYGPGDATITVTDTKTNKKYDIKVNVKERKELALSCENILNIKVNEKFTFTIISGNGEYSIDVEGKEYATATLRDKNYVDVYGVSPGNAKITVEDVKTWKKIIVYVIVEKDESTSGDVNLVKNGDMEGTDVSNFFVKINAGDINPAVISNGVGVNGSRGIKVAATARVSENWDNQFWVRLNRPVSAGTKYRFSFNYRADKSADVSTEYHAEPSEYIDWGEYITFTSAWKSYSKEGIITSSQSKTDMPFQSIAFTLNNYAGANNYYFDNIKFEVLTDEEEPPVDLKLSSTAPISLEVGEGATLEILSGNGGYNAESDKENVATATIKHETTVVIVATGPGEATITVSDKSGKTKKISVTVKDSSTSGWINLVNNSDMEGSDVSSFYERTGTWEIDPYLATISNGVGINGSRGIKVKATQKVDEIWDNQFWVRFNQPISEGTKYRFSFNYRADKNAEVREEFHAEPSEYLDWISDYINFTTNWQTFSQEGVVESNQSKDDMPFQSIAFDLNVFEGANNYYFDNFKFEVILDGQCPKPTFKLNGNKLSIQSPFTTRIYYTLDGTTPTTRSSVYTSPLALNQSCIVKAIAVVDASNISPVAAYTYSGEVEEEVDERIEDVIPSEYRDKVEQFIPIYDGINPPNVEGSYYMDLDILMGSSLSSDKIGKDFGSQYFKLSNQNSTNNTINMVRVQNGGSEWAKGEGAFISGSGNNFTIYFNSKGESSGVPFVMAYFISGTKTSDGIKNLNTGFILKEKGNDPQDKVVPVGTYRFFKDGNGMSESKAWPYGDKYGARKRTNNVNVLPGELGANY